EKEKEMRKAQENPIPIPVPVEECILMIGIGGNEKEITKEKIPVTSVIALRDKRQRENDREYRCREEKDSRDKPLESKDSAGGRHWKRQSRRTQKRTKDDLSEPYDEESTTPFIQRINEFVFLKGILMPTTVKTYDGTGDPKDHLETFTTAVIVERWAMPTWCHMFNSTLLGFPRLWFDELQPKKH
ncbi:hypothetical protein Tco_0160859, partial [Tanacetum coccineum]